MTNDQKNQHSDVFIKGAVLLGVSGIIVKILGAFFRIPLANILGPVGMSYYSSAYPIYVFFIALATAGLPTALARLISEHRALGDYKNLERTFKTGMALMLTIGLIGTILMYFGAGYVVRGIKNEMAIYSFQALAPAILLVSMLAVFRGFFQGFQEMMPFAASQIIEQIGRVFVGYFLAIALLTRGEAIAAAGATFGATAGALLGFILIFVLYKRFRKKNHAIFIADKNVHAIPRRILLKKIVLIAVPITMGAAVMPLMNTIDVAIVMNRLHDIGMGEQATSLYGMLVGYAATLVNLPQVVTAAIQISIVPAIAGYYVKNKMEALHHIIESGVRMALVISLPATAGYVVLAQPIMELLYPRQIEHAQTTGQILFIAGFGVVFLGLFQVTTGILQGMNLQKRPAINLLMGAAVKVALTYVLVGIPGINIYGAAFSSVMAYAVAAFLNIHTLKKYAFVTFDKKKVVLKPLLSVGVMSLVVMATYHTVSLGIKSNLATVIAILIGVMVYFYMLLATHTLTDSDLEMLPGGRRIKKLADLLEKNKLIPRA